MVTENPLRRVSSVAAAAVRGHGRAALESRGTPGVRPARTLATLERGDPVKPTYVPSTTEHGRRSTAFAPMKIAALAVEIRNCA